MTNREWMRDVTRYVSPIFVGLLLCTIGATRTTAVELKGRVVNRTLDRPEAGVVVQLVHHSAKSAEVLADTTSADGRFAFEVSGEPTADVPMMLSAEYKGLPYRSDRVTDLSSDIEIAVYESTDQDSNIEMISHHLIIDTQGNQATQILIFQNTGDRTYKTGGGHGHGIEVPLPNGLTEAGSDIPGVHTHGSTLVDSRPVPPGRMQLSFMTAIPADGRFVQSVKYGTPSMDAFVTPSTADVRDVSMLDLGPVTLGDRDFRRFLSENVPAGGQVSLRLAGMTIVESSGVDPFDGSGKGPWALGGMALGALLSLAYLKMGSNDVIPVKVDGDLGPEIRRTAVIQQIADLDDRLDANAIKADEHARRRDALKAEVVDLMKG
jgi:hypothetical protein